MQGFCNPPQIVINVCQLKTERLVSTGAIQEHKNVKKQLTQQLPNYITYWFCPSCLFKRCRINVLHSHVSVGCRGEPLSRQPNDVQPSGQLVEEPGVTWRR